MDNNNNQSQLLKSPPTRTRSGSYNHKHLDNYNPLPQNAPGASAAVGHTVENSIPLSIFPIALDKMCICICGLPGRGKTHISRRLARYLSFFHAIPVEVFTVAEYRLKLCGVISDAEWFDATNIEANELRSQCNKLAVEDMIEFLNKNENGVAILDSTNATHERRKFVLQMMHSTRAKVLFIEVNNENERYLSQHYEDVSISSPDYQNVSNKGDAEVDFRKRIEKYKLIYEPIDDDSHSTTKYSAIETKWSYFKCNHSLKHFVLHNVSGYMQLKIVHFIINLRTTTHSFYLSRHGQSEYNAVGRIGGDSGLSEYGVSYAQKLAEFVNTHITKDKNGNEVPARLWTSTMRRTKETAQFIKQNTIYLKDEEDPQIQYEWIQMRPRAWHHLDELFAGQFDGMTYEEIEEEYPEEFARRNIDKLAYRYPRGESYLDVIARLEPIIIEMERHREPVLIIGHQGILRIIYAFYMGLSRGDAPYVSIPLNCVIELIPTFKCQEKRYHLFTPPKPLPKDGQDEPGNKYATLEDVQSH